VTPATTLPARVRNSRKLVDAILDAAASHLSHKHDDVAVELCGVAASVSRRRHTGLFANSQLEDLLSTISARLGTTPSAANGPLSAPASTPHQPPTVLHVMTRCYALGGHTRLVSRWITAQTDVASSLVLTAPGGPEPPPDVVEAVARSGGRVHRLQGPPRERARDLRSLALAAGTVVLSIHENDLVPSLALSGARRSAVIVVNHADHVFWVGAALADVLVNLRPAARDLAIRRRGVPAEQCVDLPLPVPAAERSTSLEDAKRALGIDPSQYVLVTVGWRYKFGPVNGRDLVSALDPILADDRVHLIAIGPDEQRAPWTAARDRYGDRVRPVGAQPSTRPYFDAADVFVDSFPIPSLTAALEAGISGLPVVSLAVDVAGWPASLQEDDPALLECVYDDQTQYVERIRQLLDDPGARLRAGQQLRERILHGHGPETWPLWLDDVQRAASRRRDGQTRTRTRPTDGHGSEDCVLATYLADQEDRVVRPELRYVPAPGAPVCGTAGRFNERLRRLNALVLDSTAPDRVAYAEALRIVRSVRPWPTRFGAVGAAVSDAIRRGKTP
jgi:glycosyltransferase involved in cell wall biosynthesis